MWMIKMIIFHIVRSDKKFFNLKYIVWVKLVKF